MPADATLTLRLTDIEAFRSFVFSIGKIIQDARLEHWDRHDDPVLNALERTLADFASLQYPNSHLGNQAVHHHFGLSYANYLVLNRTLLQEMDAPWQERFVRCLEELHQTPWAIESAFSFDVRARDSAGRFTADPIPHYRRGHVGKRPSPLPLPDVPAPGDNQA